MKDSNPPPPRSWLKPATRRRPARASFALACGLALTVVLSACQANVNIGVTVNEDGSGLVEVALFLDAEATDKLLDLGLESSGLPLTDLAESGWTLERPVQGKDGSTSISASKPFGRPEQFTEVMADLTGPDRIANGFVLVRAKTFGNVEYSVIGELDPTGGLVSLGDPELEEALGVPLSDLLNHYEVSENDAVVVLNVLLPGVSGGASGSGIVTSQDGLTTGNWIVPLSTGSPTQISVKSRVSNTTPLVLRGVAIVAGVLAGIAVLAQLLRIIWPERRRRKRPSYRPTPGPGPVGATASRSVAQTGEVAVVDGEEPPDATMGGYKVVALDGMGVLYREGDDIQSLLIPFAREHGSVAADDEIRARARSMSLGRLTSGEFWRWIGVEGESEELDALYVARHQLMPGVVRFLRALRDSGVTVACITNDSVNWANRLRAAHSLGPLVDPWIISGSVGVRKPAQPVFEVLRRVTGVPPSGILVVDDELEILDAARDLGYGTAWFNPNGTEQLARGHHLVLSFESDSVLGLDYSRTTGPNSPSGSHLGD